MKMDANDFIRKEGAAGLRGAIDAALKRGDNLPPASPNGAGAGRSTPVAKLVKVSTVEAVPIRWLWPGRMALGKATLIAGHPGLGKSQLTAYLAAQVTKGAPWPAGEGSAPKGQVIMLSAEDDIADTIRPRLDAAGADIHSVHMLTAVQEGDGVRGFNLARDLAALDASLSQIGNVKLVIIDPITAYMSGTDTHKTADVRALLAPVSDLAVKHKVAVVVVSHLNKGGGGEAMTRVTGSLAFVAAARAAYVVQKDPEDPKRRLFQPIKNNLGVDDTGLAFRIEEKAVGPGIRALQSNGRPSASRSPRTRCWPRRMLKTAMKAILWERLSSSSAVHWRSVQSSTR
jgi:hypothetical protein